MSDDPFARYREALTHRSYAEEQGGGWYERLEFLGDAVLGMAISEMLFEQYPAEDPGQLTNRRKQLVKNAVLAEISRETGLPVLARVGRGESATQGKRREKFQADLVESMLGAIFLEEGWPAVRAVVRTRWRARLQRSSSRQANPKVALQELVQKRHGVVPTYRIRSQSGPAHAPVFVATVSVRGDEFAQAEGSSKAEAERKAAAEALRRLQPRRSLTP